MTEVTGWRLEIPDGTFGWIWGERLIGGRVGYVHEIFFQGGLPAVRIGFLPAIEEARDFGAVCAVAVSSAALAVSGMLYAIL